MSLGTGALKVSGEGAWGIQAPQGGFHGSPASGNHPGSTGSKKVDTNVGTTNAGLPWAAEAPAEVEGAEKPNPDAAKAVASEDSSEGTPPKVATVDEFMINGFMIDWHAVFARQIWRIPVGLSLNKRCYLTVLGWTRHEMETTAQRTRQTKANKST